MIMLKNVEFVEMVLNIFVSIITLILFRYTAKGFKYRVDASTRALYLKNYEAVLSVLCKLEKNPEVDNQDIINISNAIDDANLFLDDEIVEQLNKIKTAIISLRKQELEHCINENEDSLGKLHEYKLGLAKVYKKHIIEKFPKWLNWLIKN